MSQLQQKTVWKLLLVGLDGSGKTTLLKKFKKDVQVDQAEMITTTPFINVEKVVLPFSQDECIVYDMSGQVSFQTPDNLFNHQLIDFC